MATSGQHARARATGGRQRPHDRRDQQPPMGAHRAMIADRRGVRSASMTDPSATTPQQITERVIRSFDGCPDDRLRELMQALAGHLHAFASEVGLTSEEWERAIAALTRSGEITDERRQEFVLWSDALGLSMLVDAPAHW